MEIDANAKSPNHTHPHEQAGIVAEGEIVMGIGAEVRTLKPGDMYIVPGNVEHYARCADTPAKVLDVFSPVTKDLQY